MRSLPGFCGTILAAMCFAGGARAQGMVRGLPDCAGPPEIAGARVVRVEKNGALILSDGRAVLLEGIRLPLDAPGPLAEQALGAIRQAVQDRHTTFTAVPPKQDRYDRVRAQGFVLGREMIWLQIALLEQGLARVQVAPDRNECAPDLYEAEGRARARRAGVWAVAAYTPRSSQSMAGTAGTFQVVDGWVTNIGSGSGRVFIDFSADWTRGFSAVIQPEDRKAFRNYDLDGLTAKHVRIRGMVQNFRGRPEIALSSPSQIEVLE